jgi:hypothetical protein
MGLQTYPKANSSEILEGVIEQPKELLLQLLLKKKWHCKIYLFLSLLLHLTFSLSQVKLSTCRFITKY